MVWSLNLPYGNREPKFEWDDEPEPMAMFGFSAGGPVVDMSILPTTATQLDAKPMCDVFSMPALNAVSERFRLLVEAFEPGVHQFLPVTLKAKDGTPHEGAYYIFNCCQRLCAILATQSEKHARIWGTIKGGRNVGMPRMGGGDSDWVFSRPRIAERHLWVSQIIAGGQMFMSDAFAKRLKAEKIKYYRAKENEEVDEPWVAEEQIGPWLEWAKANPDQAFELGQ